MKKTEIRWQTETDDNFLPIVSELQYQWFVHDCIALLVSCYNPIIITTKTTAHISKICPGYTSLTLHTTVYIKRSLKLTNMSSPPQFFSHNRNTPLSKVYESVSLSRHLLLWRKASAYSMHTHTHKEQGTESLCVMHLSLWEAAVGQREPKAAGLHFVTHTREEERDTREWKRELIRKEYQIHSINVKGG